jgi:hypothetical protein
MIKISYSGYRFPPEIIQHAIWLYIRFTLSFRDVEDLLAERGIMVSCETDRRWANHFGPMVAADLRKRRPKPHTSCWVQQRPWRKRCRADGRRPEAHARKVSPLPVGMSSKAAFIVALFLSRYPPDDQISRLRLPLWTSTLKSECPINGTAAYC